MKLGATVLLALLVAETLAGAAGNAVAANPQAGAGAVIQSSGGSSGDLPAIGAVKAFNNYCFNKAVCQATMFMNYRDQYNLLVMTWGCMSAAVTKVNDSLRNNWGKPDVNVSTRDFDVAVSHAVEVAIPASDTFSVVCSRKSPVITMEFEEVQGLGSDFAVSTASGTCTFLCNSSIYTLSPVTLPAPGDYFAVGAAFATPGCNCTLAGEGFNINVVYSDFFQSTEYSNALKSSTDFPMTDEATPNEWIDGGVVYVRLNAASVGVSPLSIQAGQSANLLMTAPFGGGTAPYTCQWYAERPGNRTFGAFGDPFACVEGQTPSVPTGPLKTLGTWTFKLQVNDSSPTPLSAMSAATKLLVGLVAVKVSCTPAGIKVGGTAVCKVKVVGASVIGLVSWSSSAAGKFSTPLCRLAGGSCLVRFTPSSGLTSATLTANYLGVSGKTIAAGIVRLKVAKATTSTLVSCSPRASFGGVAAVWRCAAIISGYSPTGRVTWFDMGGSGKIQFVTFTCSAARGRCFITVRAIATGTVILQAEYAGDRNNVGSSGQASFVVKSGSRNSTAT